MAGGIDEVKLVTTAIFRVVVQRDALRLDGDSSLTLDVERVENLVSHLALRETPTELDKPVGKRRLAVVNVGDDREISNMAEVGHRIGVADKVGEG